jgi:hypothetical protein
MNMQSGFGDAGNEMMQQYIENMTNIITPVMERSVVLAAEYSKACGRDVILPEDMEYAMKYSAMCTVGDTIGSLIPEIYEDGDGDDEEDEIEEVEDKDCPQFVRYSGDDHNMNLINEAYDRWDSWVPQSPVEEMIKNAINSNGHMGA